MTEQDPIMPSELGAFTNNMVNKEGIKKLCEKVNEGSAGVTYTAGDNIQISAENVISATDTTYTAGAGISINDGAISFKGIEYVKYTGSWADLFEEPASPSHTNVAKKDLIFKFKFSGNKFNYYHMYKDFIYTRYIPMQSYGVYTDNEINLFLFDLRAFITAADNTYITTQIFRQYVTNKTVDGIAYVEMSYGMAVSNAAYLSKNVYKNPSTSQSDSVEIYVVKED